METEARIDDLVQRVRDLERENLPERVAALEKLTAAWELVFGILRRVGSGTGGLLYRFGIPLAVAWGSVAIFQCGITVPKIVP